MMFTEVLNEYNNKCKDNKSNIEGGFKALSVIYKKDILEILESSGIHELIRNAIESSLVLEQGEVIIQKKLNIAIDKYYNKIWKLRTLDSILKDELPDMSSDHFYIIKAFAKEYDSVLKLYDVIIKRNEFD